MVGCDIGVSLRAHATTSSAHNGCTKCFRMYVEVFAVVRDRSMRSSVVNTSMPNQWDGCITHGRVMKSHRINLFTSYAIVFRCCAITFNVSAIIEPGIINAIINWTLVWIVVLWAYDSCIFYNSKLDRICAWSIHKSTVALRLRPYDNLALSMRIGYGDVTLDDKKCRVTRHSLVRQ